MNRIRAAGGERDPDLILVLEHRRKYHHVSLFHLPARPGWNSCLSAEFLNLHSQSGADPASQVCADRGRAVTATARIGLEERWFTAALVFRSPASLDQHLPPADAPLSNPSPCESAPGHLDDRRKRIPRAVPDRACDKRRV